MTRVNNETTPNKPWVATRCGLLLTAITFIAFCFFITASGIDTQPIITCFIVFQSNVPGNHSVTAKSLLG